MYNIVERLYGFLCFVASGDYDYEAVKKEAAALISEIKVDFKSDKEWAELKQREGK